MKKAYVKPEIMVENFMLSEYIASCSPEFGNNLDVLIEDLKGFFGVFNSSYDCSREPTPGVDMSLGGTSLCYHTSTNVVFSS